MCGIAGLIAKKAGSADPAAIRRMTQAVAHRGPDGEGIFLSGRTALGHRRLSIIDLSDAAAQPMRLPGTALTITYNGEIYNYRELRDELAALGHIFQTQSDTEVILAAYAAWGEECLGHFNGMWAFAILDEARSRVFCARDRFGVKPFYFVDTPEVFAFGSEIRQLLPFLGHIAANRDRLSTFLSTGAIDLDERTLFTGVRKLPAGHFGHYDLRTDRFEATRYYRLESQPNLSTVDDRQAAEQLAGLLESAVELRLRSDVKVGTCLSGGLDSSAVATLASERFAAAGGGQFSAITAVSEEPGTDETPYAQIVAERSGLDWHRVRPTYDDFRDSLAAVVDAQEEPFGSPSLTMQYFVMQSARANGISVLLDGQGGDEALLGYDKYLGAYVNERLRRRGPLAALQAIRAIGANNAHMRPAAMAKYLLGSQLGRLRYALHRRQHSYLRDLPARSRHIEAFSQAKSDPFALQELEITSTNLPVLLRYEDKNSMAHGVEARLPFLDYRLLEFAVSLPLCLKIRDGWSKWLLRKAVEGRIPDEIAWRRNKLSFDAPEALWLARHLPEMQKAVLASPLLGDLADRAKLAAAYPKLDRRSQWRLYSVALWEAQFGIAA